MKYLIYILMVGLLFSCKKKESNAIPYYYEYFPLELNAWIEYQVESINHTSVGSDTLNYWLHEEVTEEFLDDQGRLSFRIERFWKFSETESWQIKDVWYANTTTTTAEKVEENIRYTKLVFPVSSSKYWDGNAFNSLNEWEYHYDSLHMAKTINLLSFDSTLKVVQRDNINVVEHEEAEEIYAKHVGMIYRKLVDYNVNFGAKEGIELEMIVTGYGK